MTITTEKAERLVERLAHDAEAPQAARYQPYTDRAMRNAAAALRSLATERDALQARVTKLETALQFIKDAPEEDRKPNWNNMGSYEAGLRYCAAFARAALTGGKDE